MTILSEVKIALGTVIDPDGTFIGELPEEKVDQTCEYVICSDINRIKVISQINGVVTIVETTTGFQSTLNVDAFDLLFTKAS